MYMDIFILLMHVFKYIIPFTFVYVLIPTAANRKTSTE
jgi:hypothetical protein